MAETHPDTSGEELRLWSKGERVIFTAYPRLEGVVEEEAGLYPVVRWPGHNRSHAIHTSQLLPSVDQPEGPIDEGEQTYCVLYRENDGLYMAMNASSSGQAQELANALTAATGTAHWVDLVEDIVRAEGSNRVCWKR